MSSLSSKLRTNWKAGLSVALISLPLSLSLAIASKAAPITGVITAVWAGLAAAIFGGSVYNVIGPAGALSGILATYAMTYGAENLPMLAILTGVLTLVFYALKWDKYIVFIPSSVVHGFTLGVALIIGLNQLNFALGIQGLPSHESLIMNLAETFKHIGSTDIPTFILFLGGLGLLFLVLRLAPTLPGPVILAILGIGLGYASESGIIALKFQTLLDKFGSFETEIVKIPSFTLPPMRVQFLNILLTTTIVAILETILSAKIADTMAKARHAFDQRREVLGLAIANLASGIMGGLPATGVLARTALNVKTGATSRLASGMNTIFLLILTLILFKGFQYLPLATVASILVYVSIRMVGLEHYSDLFTFDKTMFGLSIVVGVLTVVVDPLVAILLGSTVSMLLFLRQLSRGQSEITIHRDRRLVSRVSHQRLHDLDDHGDVTVYRFAGELTYFNGASHRHNILSLRSCHTIILSLRNLFYIDLDGLRTLEGIHKEAVRLGKRTIITGAGESILPSLRKSEWFEEETKAGNVFSSTTDALTHLGFPLVKAGG